MAWTGFGGGSRSSGGFSSNGPNAAQNAENNRNAGHYGGMFGGGDTRGSRNGGGNGGGSDRNTSRTTTRTTAAKPAAAKPAAATPNRTTRVGPTGVPITEIQGTPATPEQAAYADSLAGRINGFLTNTLGIGGSYTGKSTVGGFGEPGTISGTLLGGLSGFRAGSALGPFGGLLGAVGGMISGSGVMSNFSFNDIRGINPNGPGGVSAGYSIGQRLANGQVVGNGNGGNGRASSGGTTAAAAGLGGAGDQSIKGLINALAPGGVGGLQNAGNKAQNEYLNLLRGRYGRYLLTTGAQGSGTGLLGRTVGGTGAVGGTSGRVILGG